MDETHDDMTSYQRWEHGMIEDIGHDTDSIIKMLGSEKMGESFDTGALMGMLANKGVDPGIIAMLNDCKEKGSWGDGGMLIVLFLILILGFGGNGGFFGRGQAGDVAGVDRTVVNEANYSRMLDAIGGNREAIGQLAQTLNCTQGQITSALAGVDKQIAVNQGSIINAVQSCCCNIQGKIQDCCCQTNLNIERQGCQTRQDIQDTRFLIQATASAQDNLVQGLFNAQNAYLADQFCQIKSREDQREIQALRDKLAEQRDSANTLAILNAIQNKDSIAFQGTAGATAFTGTGSLS
ncbi:TPA_asm: hypothetical protein vir215_00065 [Ventrumvirus gergoviense]|uniref:Uncharacterized protein n=1 Tax=Caudoviricetes sp. vir215 TaxID=3068354 RepID=A0AA86XT41_9CAUD|nr:TPA_asm: hypothetical protein vir215_00065 [Caudoviricetes sp. vir215]